MDAICICYLHLGFPLTRDTGELYDRKGGRSIPLRWRIGGEEKKLNLVEDNGNKKDRIPGK